MIDFFWPDFEMCIVFLQEEGTESEMREAFLDAVTKAEDFIRKKVLGLPCESLEFFEDGEFSKDIQILQWLNGKAKKN